MNINEIVKFPNQLIHVETTHVKSEKQGKLTQNEFNVEAHIEGEILDKNKGSSVITIKVSNDEYYIEITKVGIFKFEQEIEDEKEAKKFLEIQGVRILWSYVREDIYSISAKMLPHPIMIPTIDVLQTIKKAQ